MKYEIKSTFGYGNSQSLSACKDFVYLNPSTGEEIVFDFSKYKDNNPFGNLILINSLRRYKNEHPDIRRTCIPKESDDYLEHIGFYQAIGVNHGKRPGEAHANESYVPITELDLKSEDFYGEIEKRAKELAATLNFDSSLQKMVTYILIETIRNAYEHSKTENVLVAAQKWPKHNLVEIAIADAGCGVVGSLGKLYAMENTELLKWACQPGITARSNFMLLDKDDPWRNSGYGLYIVKELCLAYNSGFTLCSGKKAIRYYDGHVYEYDTDYAGTAICIRFRTDTDNDFEAIRKKIVSEGEEKSKSIKEAIKKASKSSGGRYHI